MRTHFWVSLFVLGLCIGNVKAQKGLQLGLKGGLGRSFTTVDYSQATDTRLEGVGGPSAHVGLEVAWFPHPKWRIATGLTYTAQEMVVHQSATTLVSTMSVSHDYISIPLDMSYLLFTDKHAEKSVWLIGGLSSDWVGQGSSWTSRSSGNSEPELAPGESQMLGASSVSFMNASLRMGLGQAWVLGKNNRFTLQINMIYSQGLFPVREGYFLYWDKTPPADWWRESSLRNPNGLIEIMPEPIGTYNAILSRGSSLTLEIKLFFNIMRKGNR